MASLLDGCDDDSKTGGVNLLLVKLLKDFVFKTFISSYLLHHQKYHVEYEKFFCNRSYLSSSVVEYKMIISF